MVSTDWVVVLLLVITLWGDDFWLPLGAALLLIGITHYGMVL